MTLIRFGDDLINVDNIAGVTPLYKPRGDEPGGEIIGCRVYLAGGVKFDLDGPEAWRWFVAHSQSHDSVQAARAEMIDRDNYQL